jgi:HTH-type transcriptional regulator / antitoxin HipB
LTNESGIENTPDREYFFVWIVLMAILSRSGISAPPHPEIAEIAAAVRTTRQNHQLTQAQLAGLSGTGLRFISDLERGKPTLALNKVLAVLSALGLRLVVRGDHP